jgi:hypothetical protein
MLLGFLAGAALADIAALSPSDDREAGAYINDATMLTELSFGYV